MHGERDALTQVVFPALNQRCEPRRVRVIPIDLRWGLTLEQCRVNGALTLCLQEIENSGFLVGYRLKIYLADTGCQSREATSSGQS